MKPSKDPYSKPRAARVFARPEDARGQWLTHPPRLTHAHASRTAKPSPSKLAPRVSTPEAAELTKLLENIFRSVNIALVNELAMLTDRIGIDIWEVIHAASTKPYRFMRFEPGPGMGGHCLPVDPFYLSWRARELDMSPGVGDIRESPALKILTLLKGLGAELRYHDPHVPTLRDYGLQSLSLDEALEDADLALILTAHPQVDHQLLAQRARLLVDLRGVTRTLGVADAVRL
jgi:UDP-N-acetyl-D-glucosamine dehydrogenase